MAGKKVKTKPKNKSFSCNSRKLTCPTCGYVTFIKARFTKHVKYHSMPFIKCEYCDFRTQYTWNLDRHMKNHTYEGSMKCPLCNFSCETRQSLTSHVQNHHNDVPEDVMAQFRGVPSAPTSTTTSPTGSGHIHISHNKKVPTTTKNVNYQTSLNEDATGLFDTDLTQAVQEYYLNAGLSAVDVDTDDSVRDSGMTIRPLKRLGAGLRQQNEKRLLMKKRFYKCRRCNFNALSQDGLNYHIMQRHPQQFQDDMVVDEYEDCAVPTEVPEQADVILKTKLTGDKMPTLIKNSPIIATSTIKPMPSLIPIPKNKITEQCNSNNFQKVQLEDKPQGCGDGDETSEKTVFLSNLGLFPVPTGTAKGDAQTGENALSGHRKFMPQRRTSFFDKLTKKLTSSGGNQDACGGSSGVTTSTMSHSVSADSQVLLSNSTRCQYCRHRCKSSIDLMHHLKKCEEAQRCLGTENLEQDEEDDRDQNADEQGSQQIFVWNEASNEWDDRDDNGELQIDEGDPQQFDELSISNSATPSPGAQITKSRKVYQCPEKNCQFWATTASRFHVHIVGHYNKKPFECSQCSYRSNWRWDITKHIRLKTTRDPSHSKAKVLLIDESGERNYRKYDRYLVPMDVTYNADAKLPDCSTVASKRPDVDISQIPLSPEVKRPATKTNEVSMAMPKLTKAPSVSPHSTLGLGEYSIHGGGHNLGSFRNEILSGALGKRKAASSSPALPMLKPIITISPLPPGTPLTGSKGSGGRTFVEKNMLAGGEILHNMDGLGREITVTPIPKITSNFRVPSEDGKYLHVPDNKPTWKCKKCAFRHWNKAQVILHINEIHKGKSFDQFSNKNSSGAPGTAQGVGRGSIFTCDRCSYSTNSSAAIMHHYAKCWGQEKESYTDANGHHENAAEHFDNQHSDEEIVESKDETLILPEEIHTKPPKGSVQYGIVYKKYHCSECPYVTDSKGQFIYHKRFHIPNPTASAPYKCTQCSYRVSHKHLLHQHIRVHFQEQEHQDEELGLYPEVEPQYDESESDGSCDNSRTASAHPKVLMWKGGRPYSMFRCKLCPLIFARVEDLTEHEEQHDLKSDNATALNLSLNTGTKTEPARKDGGASPVPLLYLCDHCPARFLYEKELRIHDTFHQKENEFRCELCSYSARQQVPHLMSHMKVHSQDYQEKTQMLLQGQYQVAPKNLSTNNATKSAMASQHRPSARPSGVEIALNSFKKLKPVTISPTSTTTTNSSFSLADASIPCRKCPARFNSIATFLQHSNNHGRQTRYKCRHCDFGAESQNNLTLHSILHAGSEVTIEPEVELSPGVEVLMDVGQDDEDEHGSSFYNEIPTVVPHHSQYIEPAKTLDDMSVAQAYQGNPAFNYPTYVKNGKIKSKRYKCFKCPSAFEKRDQYRVHIGLHGSNQRYKCTVCDYSVTYYANFIQHLKKHENQANVTKEQLVATPISKINKVQAQKDKEATVDVKPEVPTIAHKVPPLILKVPKSSINPSTPSQSLPTTRACDKCPFRTASLVAMSQHSSCHGSGQKEKCVFCDFSSDEKEILKGHLRVHFDTDFKPFISPSGLVHMDDANSSGQEEDLRSDSDDGDYEATITKENKRRILVTNNNGKDQISVD